MQYNFIYPYVAGILALLIIITLLIHRVIQGEATTWKQHIAKFARYHLVAFLLISSSLSYTAGLITQPAVKQIFDFSGGFLDKHAHVTPVLAGGSVVPYGALNVDLTHYLHPASNQGTSNACNVFANTNVLEWFYARAGQPVDLSKFFVYYEVQGQQNRGTSFEEVQHELVTVGAPLVQYYPEVNNGPAPTVSQLQAAFQYRSAGFTYVYAGNWGSQEVDSTRDALATYQTPLVAAFHVYQNWASAFGAVELVPQSGTYLFDHATMVVGGHDDSSYPGGGYFVLQNSWGSAWGDNGLIRISYAEFQHEAFSVERPLDPHIQSVSILPTPGPTRLPATPAPQSVYHPKIVQTRYRGIFAVTRHTNLRSSFDGAGHVVSGLSPGTRLRSESRRVDKWLAVHFQKHHKWLYGWVPQGSVKRI